ncbi:MAG: PLP-dependent aminotransferase family protein [Holophagales bacterium]|nr:PLP-dependent aminotransferase family protein [Holophagales bacterium]
MTTPAPPEPLPEETPGRVPLYRTIADGVIRDIRRGRFQEGSRLPASRALARTHEVNRATVHQALQVLKREGWIETNKGGGTRVARRSLAGPMVGPAPSWDRISSALLGRILAETGAQDGAPAQAQDLARLAPDEREFPAEAFAKVLAEVARDGALLAYGSPFGYRPLRETLAARLQRRGIPADADAILIVNGAQQGLDLITRALVDPGDAVAVENPSYSGALSLLRAHGARLLGVPLDAEGPEPEALAPRWPNARSSSTRSPTSRIRPGSWPPRPAGASSSPRRRRRASSSWRTPSTPTSRWKGTSRSRSPRSRRATSSTSGRSPRRSSRACASGGSRARANSSTASRR